MQEAIDLWKTNKVLDEKTNSSTVGSDTELLDSLEEQQLLTPTEREELETMGQTKIGDRVIEFDITLEEIYTDDMIGQSITYLANEQSEWIVFGKDKDGNILITTKEPIENGLKLSGTAQSWLSYEEDLKEACSGFATQIQGRNDITARSITMDDINYVTSFKKPDLSNYRYRFGSTPDNENRIINCYYPSLLASSTGYWQTPSDDNLWTPGEELDPYSYGYNDGQFKYAGPDNNFTISPLKNGKINEERYKYVVGERYKEEKFLPRYAVSSRSVKIDSTSTASFNIGVVTNGYVMIDESNGYRLCISTTNNYQESGFNTTLSVRPIVVLPPDLKVKKTSSGNYDLK